MDERAKARGDADDARGDNGGRGDATPAFPLALAESAAAGTCEGIGEKCAREGKRGDEGKAGEEGRLTDGGAEGPEVDRGDGRWYMVHVEREEARERKSEAGHVHKNQATMK